MGARFERWKSTLKTGHTKIDEQHRGLFRRFDELIDAKLKKGGDKQAVDLIFFLMKYTKEHFQYEEDYYKRKGYPNYLCHKEMHQEFIAELEKLKAECFDEECDNEKMVQSLNTRLGEWLRQHILMEDMEATKWINDNPSEYHTLESGLKLKRRE